MGERGRGPWGGGYLSFVTPGHVVAVGQRDRDRDQAKMDFIGLADAYCRSQCMPGCCLLSTNDAAANCLLRRAEIGKLDTQASTETPEIPLSDDASGGWARGA
jgi:hypothetical protein